MKTLPIDCHIHIPLEIPGSGGKQKAAYRCDDNLLCGRCSKCIEHCTCGPAQRRVERPKKLKKGEVVLDQMQLCEKPVLRLK